MKPLSILLLTLSLAAVSCERQEFDGPKGTKQLNQHHAASTEHGEHTDAAAHGEHAEKAEH